MSDAALPLSLLVAGFASGLHCAGMCGGIAAGFSVLQKEKVWKRQLAFNLGRLMTYAAAGAAAGAVGAGAYAAAALPAQTALYVLAGVVLFVAGMHLAGFSSFLSTLERLGMPLWRRVQPRAVRLLAMRPFAAGLAWGFLPCGLVYGALAAAAFAGGPAQGALAMLAFGAGTLPWLLAAGVGAARLRGWFKSSAVRVGGGAILMGTGAWSAAHASGLSDAVRQSLLCF
jgi:sulfite exporter TauE/SafE